MILNREFILKRKKEAENHGETSDRQTDRGFCSVSEG